MAAALANPFVKGQFASYRDWEDALVAFLCHEAQEPDEAQWMASAGEAKEDVAFCALLLSNVLGSRAEFAAASAAAYRAFQRLNNTGAGAREYERWLQSGWLNVSRVANALAMRLRTATHH